MGSISIGELKSLIQDIPDDYEALMFIRHRYDIPKEEGEKGWIAFINGVEINDEHHEIRLMN